MEMGLPAGEPSAQAAGTGLALECLAGNGLQRLRAEFQLHAFHLEQLLELLGDGVARLGEDLHQGGFVQLVERGNHRQAASHRFQHRIGNSFLVGIRRKLTWMNENMAFAINPAQIILAEETGQRDLIPEGELVNPSP